MSIQQLQSNAELCARYAAALYRNGFTESARKWGAIAEGFWQDWIAAKEQSTQTACAA